MDTQGCTDVLAQRIPSQLLEKFAHSYLSRYYVSSHNDSSYNDISNKIRRHFPLARFLINLHGNRLSTKETIFQHRGWCEKAKLTWKWFSILFFVLDIPIMVASLSLSLSLSLFLPHNSFILFRVIPFLHFLSLFLSYNYFPFAIVFLSFSLILTLYLVLFLFVFFILSFPFQT